MRKLISFIVVVMLCSTTFAQLRVASNGNVAINLASTVTPLSPLTIGGTGDSNAKAYFLNQSPDAHYMRSKIAGKVYTSWAVPFLGQNTVLSALYHVGVWGSSGSSTVNDFGRAFGVFGLASNATSGYNYGVFGTIEGSNNGAGVVGTTNGNTDVNIPGKYAGYFVGNVAITGIVTAQNVSGSDSRLKTNISSLTESAKETGVLSKVLSLNPVQYNLKQMYIESKGDSTKASIPLYDEKSQQFQKTHFGLIAQELQKVYPELVYEQDNGYLSVDYVGLVPLLIQSIKEMKAEIEDLKSSDASRSIANEESETIQSNTLTENLTPVLYQNTPNPFSQQTEIKYFIPANTKTAFLCIYDLQGKQLKQIALGERGEEGAQTILGSEFAAGIYLYGLIADAKQIDLKRMVLTE
ncbi:MAG: tail fiber domain-containing protein [Bacteroidales bacterium]|nr:tail fiber domain-containing protein [Bacteroidales bacterium]